MELREYLESELGVEVKNRNSANVHMVATLEHEMEDRSYLASLSAVRGKVMQKQRCGGSLKAEYTLENPGDLSVPEVRRAVDEYFISQGYKRVDIEVKTFSNDKEVIFPIVSKLSKESEHIVIYFVG